MGIPPPFPECFRSASALLPGCPRGASGVPRKASGLLPGVARGGPGRSPCAFPFWLGRCAAGASAPGEFPILRELQADSEAAVLELATLGVAALLTERRIVLDVPFMSHAFEAPFADGCRPSRALSHRVVLL